MADIISGGSRFTGDKKAPVKKVIQLNTDNKEQTAVTDEADYEEVKLRIRRHRIRMGVLVLIVVALIVGAVLLAMHLLDGYTIAHIVSRVLLTERIQQPHSILPTMADT